MIGQELRRCPFCGAEAIMMHVGGMWVVSCGNGSCMVQTPRYMDRRRPGEIWNRRMENETV